MTFPVRLRPRADGVQMPPKEPSDASRSALNTSSERYFREAYDDVMYSGMIGWYSRFVHKLMERPYRGMHTPVVLELGAGAGQHVEHVSSSFERYLETDLDPSLATVAQRQDDDGTVVRQQANAEDLADFADASVDRVIATCLLAHLDQPERALREWRRVVRPGGYLTIYVPTEPGMLLRSLRHGFVAPKSRRRGQDHLAVVYRDHRNHYPGMRAMISEVFGKDEVRRVRFPSRLIGWNLCLFEVYHVRRSPWIPRGR